MFLHLSVSHSVHGGGAASGLRGGWGVVGCVCVTISGMDGLSATPPGQTPPPLGRHPPLADTPFCPVHAGIQCPTLCML